MPSETTLMNRTTTRLAHESHDLACALSSLHTPGGKYPTRIVFTFIYFISLHQHHFTQFHEPSTAIRSDPRLTTACSIDDAPEGTGYCPCTRV